MRKILSFVVDHFEGIGAILVLIAIFLFVRFELSNTNNKGVITIAKVIRYEGSESGSELYIEIYLEGKIYTTSIGQECKNDCVGNYFFVKVLKDNPISYVIFYGSKQVPECIIKNVIYFKGWSFIPDCKNY